MRAFLALDCCISECLIAAALVVGFSWLGGAQVCDSAELSKYYQERPVPKIALVIGAEKYNYFSPVDNALNDAILIDQTLLAAGFRPKLLQNPTREEILNEIEYYSSQAKSVDGPIVTLFYFAGHGFQSGEDYILPIDALPGEKGERLLYDGISVTHVLDKLSRLSGGMSIVIIDACRNSLSHLQYGERGIDSFDGAYEYAGNFDGLEAPERYIIAYAAESGEPAKSFYNRGEVNSPFTFVMTHFIAEKGMSIREVMMRVRGEVERRTRHEQSPRDLSSLLGDFFFFPTSVQDDRDRESWLNALMSSDWGKVQDYLDQNPGSLYGFSAMQWLGDHRGSNEE